MYAVSDRWESALRTSGTIVSRAEVWRAGAFTGTTLNLTGGTVRVDDSSKVRRSLSLSSSDVDLMPRTVDDLLRPTDTDLKVFTGVGYTEGDTELVPVFTGRLQEPARTGWRSDLTLTAVDYAKVLEDARFPRPWNIARGSNARAFDTFRSVVQDVLPWVNVYNLTGRNGRMAGTAFDRSRIEALDLLAHVCGGEWWFTPDGDCIVSRPARSLAPDPVWWIDANSPTAVLTESGHSMSGDKVYNAVTATSAPTDGPVVTVTVYLTSGPLRYRDGYQRPRFFKSPLPMTRNELTTTAKDLLTRSVQLVTQVTASCAPNPALEVGDVVAVDLPNGDTVKRLVNGFTVPLSVGDIGSSGMAVDLVTPVELTEIGDVDL
ncbi:MAG: DUF5047 domain-containing protein [Hamadaea sp.]|nr:DUF5047 domain-containing protein [Dermatophilaceae bacterium]NUR48151.1 DUF5047 domain-containing protein [Hamadaea sp.]NUS17805.1 DUF5047 domain-containing protein [Streptomyces sp.]NUT08676.1 DUF5047 domain-containing protein [Hamadaea sp.]